MNKKRSYYIPSGHLHCLRAYCMRRPVVYLESFHSKAFFWRVIDCAARNLFQASAHVHNADTHGQQAESWCMAHDGSCVTLLMRLTYETYDLHGARRWLSPMISWTSISVVFYFLFLDVGEFSAPSCMWCMWPISPSVKVSSQQLSNQRRSHHCLKSQGSTGLHLLTIVQSST